MRILGVDTSGKTASVAILDTEKKILLGEHSIYTSRTHSQVIMPMCKRILQECNVSIPEIDRFCVAVGPGSYTGLRIGIAAVQGMAMVNQTPCVGVSTLEAMAARVYAAPVLLSVMYAREDLFYAAVFQDKYTDTRDFMERVTPDEVLHVSEIAQQIACYQSLVLVGDGAEEFARQYAQLHVSAHVAFRFAPAHLRLQSAAGVCLCAAHQKAGTPADLTASYLQAVRIQK